MNNNIYTEEDAIDILNRMKSLSNVKVEELLNNFFRKMKIKKIKQRINNENN